MVNVHGDEIALLPCPFCGEQEMLSIEEVRPPDEGLVVECESCQSQGPLSESMFNAAMSWNERPSMGKGEQR
jgi:Lar family restriction alleviation protein